jgi:hypothetical protein
MINDSTTVAALRSFIAAPKPPELLPEDILQVIWAILHKAEDHYVYPSQLTLAQAFNCSINGISRGQKRLATLGWLSVTHQRGRPNLIGLNLDKLPHGQALKTMISEDAQELAARYKIGLQKKTKRTRFPKLWLQQQQLTAQRMLDDCKGDVELVAKLIGYALNSPEFYKRAAKSLYNTFTVWKRIKDGYTQQRATWQHQQQQQEPRNQ